METFRLLHISDLHLSAKHIGWINEFSAKTGFVPGWLLRQLFSGKNVFYPSTFDQDIAIAAARHISRQAYQVDALIASGDLATTGSELDLNAARDFLLGNLPTTWSANRYLRYPLIQPGMPTIIMPGNHDRYKTDAASWLQPGCANFENVFGPEWNLTAHQNDLITHALPGLKEVRLFKLTKGAEQLLIFCIDFTLRARADADGAFGWVGQGKAYDDIIARLTEYILMHKEQHGSNDAICWVTHFPPAKPDGPATRDILRLLDENHLLKAADDCQVDFMMAGHLHEQRQYSMNSDTHSTAIFCAGSMCSVEKDEDDLNGFLEIEFDIHGGKVSRLQHIDYKYDEDASAFTERP